jgi:hypothetical protein
MRRPPNRKLVVLAAAMLVAAASLSLARLPGGGDPAASAVLSRFIGGS